jgi:hypothetical protein
MEMLHSKLPERRVRLNLTKHFIYRCLAALGFILLLLLAIEMVCRTQFVKTKVPLQAYGSNHIQFDFQIQNFKSYVDENGEPDCFILGTSMPLRAINPTLLDQVYIQTTGHSIKCYNLSVVGSSMAANAAYVDMLIRHYQPEIILLGTNFLDFSERRENADDTRFSGSSWMQFQVGQLNLDGLLVDHSYAYRMIKLLSYGAPTRLDYQELNKEIKKWRKQITKTGFSYSERVEDVSVPVKPAKNRNFLKTFGDFKPSQRNLAAIEQMATNARRANVQFVILEMPYHPSLLELLDGDGQPLPHKDRLLDLIQQVNTEIEQIAKQNQVPVWKLGSTDLISDQSWHDRYHLNHFGSEEYSAWLAKRIANAVASGEIPEPGGE